LNSLTLMTILFRLYRVESVSERPPSKHSEMPSSTTTTLTEGPRGPSSCTDRRLLLHASTSSDYFAKYTSVGIVDAPPAACWDLIGDTASWLTSISGVRKVGNRARQGLFCETYNVVQTTKVNLVGKDFHVDMQLGIESNSLKREMHFTCKKRNKLMSRLEGSFKVISIGDRRRLRQALPNLGQEHLDALLSVPGGRHKSIVVLDQAVQPSVMPPKFVRGMFCKHLGRSIDGVMKDLQRGAEAKNRAANTLSCLLPTLTSSTMPAMPALSLVPAFATIGKFVTETCS